MTATLIVPLRKIAASGKLYTRLPEIEAKLVKIHSLTRDEISARCEIHDPGSTDYLPSECLLYLVRQHRSSPIDACSEKLFKTLLGRVLRGLPQAESQDGRSERLTDCNVRDDARHRFLEMLMNDRQAYDERLDFYEVRFQMALKKLRLDAQKKIYGEVEHLESIEIDHETGEIAEKVERAAGSFDPLNWDKTGDSDYLLHLDKAIDALPALQKAIVELIRKGIPIESKEPGAVDIAKTLGKSEKTIRTHRDKAYAALRTTLTKGELR
jgi:hypothetical protein